MTGRRVGERVPVFTGAGSYPREQPADLSRSLTRQRGEVVAEPERRALRCGAFLVVLVVRDRDGHVRDVADRRAAEPGFGELGDQVAYTRRAVECAFVDRDRGERSGERLRHREAGVPRGRIAFGRVPLVCEPAPVHHDEAPALEPVEDLADRRRAVPIRPDRELSDGARVETERRQRPHSAPGREHDVIRDGDRLHAQVILAR